MLSAGAFGQIKTQWGLQGGFTESKVQILDNPDQANIHNELDVYGGVFYRFYGKKFEIQPEFYYQKVGGSHTGFANRYEYLTVPLLFGYKPTEGLTLQIGPEYSYALSSKTTYAPDKPSDWGISTGFRIDMLDGFSLFSFNFRYTWGMSNVAERVSLSKIPLDFRNRIFQVGVSYNFSDLYRWNKKHKVVKK